MGPRTAAPRTRRLLAPIVAGLVLMACTADQDPGLEAPLDSPIETSNTLGLCPAGGPDATTPPAGCLGPDGVVLRP